MSSTTGARFRTGKVVATGAALAIRIVGFKPAKVRVTNETTLYSLEWLKGMADASAFEITNAGAKTLETSDCITLLDPDSNGNPGFQIGARANVNDTTTEVLRWEAWEDANEPA
jgi:hypothetical protein